MRPEHVLILFNKPILPAGHPDAESEQDILTSVYAVRDALHDAGFPVACEGVGSEPGPLVATLRRNRPDVVFNLFEGTPDDGSDEPYVAGLLDWLRLPFTGCPPSALHLARNKPATKQLLRGAGVPTAEFFVVEHLPVEPCMLQYPVIVKPGLQDASLGLDQGSVVRDQYTLEQRVAYLLETWGPPVLVEEYVAGRELNVGLAETKELQLLPFSEIIFQSDGADLWPIVTYDAKWRPWTRDYIATPPRCPADVNPRVAAKLTEIAKKAYSLIGCRDYARVDFRVTPAGRPFVLEVNPNPDYSPSAGFARALAAAGTTYEQFTVDLVENALRRGGRQSPIIPLELDVASIPLPPPKKRRARTVKIAAGEG